MRPTSTCRCNFIDKGIHGTSWCRSSPSRVGERRSGLSGRVAIACVRGYLRRLLVCDCVARRQSLVNYDSCRLRRWSWCRIGHFNGGIAQCRLIEKVHMSIDNDTLGKDRSWFGRFLKFSQILSDIEQVDLVRGIVVVGCLIIIHRCGKTSNTQSDGIALSKSRWSSGLIRWLTRHCWRAKV